MSNYSIKCFSKIPTDPFAKIEPLQSTNTNAIKDHSTPCEDEVVEAVIARLRQRSKVGVEKYGTTLSDDLTTSHKEKLNHLLEELLDGANYIQWIISKLK